MQPFVSRCENVTPEMRAMTIEAELVSGCVLSSVTAGKYGASAAGAERYQCSSPFMTESGPVLMMCAASTACTELKWRGATAAAPSWFATRPSERSQPSSLSMFGLIELIVELETYTSASGLPNTISLYGISNCSSCWNVTRPTRAIDAPALPPRDVWMMMV